MAPATVNTTTVDPFTKDCITLAYYAGTLFVAIVALLYGTIYMPRRNREDEQRREWRKFAKSVFGENSILRAQDIPQRISKVKDTFKNIQMNSQITGLDVLRYMLAEGNYESFKTEELECLHDNLQSIFQLFCDVHSSLPLLGKVPRNVKEKLKDVTELGMIVEPFFEGRKREIILECLEHFSINRPIETVSAAVPPYVKTCLRFGVLASLLEGFPYGTRNGPDYSKCSNFSLYIEDDNTHGGDLQELHKGLVDQRCLKQNARKLRTLAPKLNLIEKINDDDKDERVVEKVLHEVHVYIDNASQNNEDIEKNITILLNLWKDMRRIWPSEVIVQAIWDRLIGDLEIFQASQLPCNQCNGEQVCKKLQKILQTHMNEIQSIKWNDSTSLPSTPQIANSQYISNV